MRYISEDLELNYEVIGNGTPIIMLNGYFNDLIAWKSCMELILKNRPNYKRIYLDYPGTGKSNVSNSIKTWNNLLECILEFIEHVIPGENFIIVGHSVGAFLARGILKRKFEHIDGIMLTCPVVKPRLQDRCIDKKVSNMLNINADRLKYIKARINREVVKSRKNTNKKYLKELRSNSIETEYDFDDLDKLFIKPALFVAGRQDTVVGYKDLYGLLDNYPRASLIILDNGKHDIQIEQDDIFHILVHEWLSRIEDHIANSNK
ncbi:alpha/beta fold hydrolase [Alkaliphilus transvaalensis]|uniref:alpha/beta fold hydrolase n=1 Tax=Alkaliphilus transvaalensis TaxID=114628 RepID=UPI00047CF112|nr:alpha/beta hydrolase [Alkaliphilus transvaalensis]